MCFQRRYTCFRRPERVSSRLDPRPSLRKLGRMLFQDRRDAGRQLACLVATLPHLNDAIVLALPRGGVPVAFEVARALGLPLDLLVVRKLGAPRQRELAMGAIASGGVVALNPDIMQAFHISEQAANAAAAREMLELKRMEHSWRNGLAPLPIEGQTVILVDDGLATGATMRAAVQAVKTRARQVVVAVPVGPESTCRELQSEVDSLLCVAMPEPFFAVGSFYANFEPTNDQEVVTLLAETRCGTGPQPAG